jgi:hypothetical protein
MWRTLIRIGGRIRKRTNTALDWVLELEPNERELMPINLIPAYCVEKPYLDPRRSAPVALSQAVGLMIALEEQERRAEAFVSACNIIEHLNTKQIRRSFTNALRFADALQIESLKGK